MRNLAVSSASDRQVGGLPDDVARCAWDFESGGAYLCTASGTIMFVPAGSRQVRPSAAAAQGVQDRMPHAFQCIPLKHDSEPHS